MAGWLLKRALLLLLTMKLIACPDSSAGPLLKAVAQLLTVCAPASSVTVWSAPLVNEGTSLTVITVIVIVLVLSDMAELVPCCEVSSTTRTSLVPSQVDAPSVYVLSNARTVKAGGVPL